MEPFNRILINTKDEDITIRDDVPPFVSGGHYKVKDKCLIVTPDDDMEIAIPNGEYEEIRIYSINGDILLNFHKICLNCVVFESINGDLSLSGNCQNVSFKSINGEYHRLSFGEQIHEQNRSKRRTTTYGVNRVNDDQIWIGNERYK